MILTYAVTMASTNGVDHIEHMSQSQATQSSSKHETSIEHLQQEFSDARAFEDGDGPSVADKDFSGMERGSDKSVTTQMSWEDIMNMNFDREEDDADEVRAANAIRSAGSASPSNNVSAENAILEDSSHTSTIEDASLQDDAGIEESHFSDDIRQIVDQFSSPMLPYVGFDDEIIRQDVLHFFPEDVQRRKRNGMHRSRSDPRIGAQVPRLSSLRHVRSAGDLSSETMEVNADRGKNEEGESIGGTSSSPGPTPMHASLNSIPQDRDYELSDMPRLPASPSASSPREASTDKTDTKDNLGLDSQKKSEYSKAGRALEQMKNFSQSDRALPLTQQPSFKGKYLLEQIERLCRRIPQRPNDAWDPSSFALVVRMLLDNIEDALGPLHTCTEQSGVLSVLEA